MYEDGCVEGVKNITALRLGTKPQPMMINKIPLVRNKVAERGWGAATFELV